MHPRPPQAARRPRRHRSRRTRFWRKGPEATRSMLSKGRRSTSRRPGRFSPLTVWTPEPELSPLYKIPTLLPWLATRDSPTMLGAAAG